MESKNRVLDAESVHFDALMECRKRTSDTESVRFALHLEQTLKDEHQKEVKPPLLGFLPRIDYLNKVRSDLEGRFRDRNGYVAGTIDGKPKPDGEATLYTAIAAIAISTTSFAQNGWEVGRANSMLASLLNVLLTKSWSDKPDQFGRHSPIRHPEVLEFKKSGEVLRQTPISKDSFGAIVCAAYFSFKYSDREMD